MAEYDGITMLTYIRETPSQLAKNISRRKELTRSLVDVYLNGSYRSIWVIACGSSANGSSCARPFMRKCLGHDVEVINPASFLYSDFLPSDDTLCFVVSQSGCSTNSLEALDKLHELNRPAIGITGNLEGDFRDHTDLLVDWGAETEIVGYVTKGVTTLAAYLMLFALEAGLAKGTVSQAAYDDLVAQLEIVPAVNEEVQRRTDAFFEENREALTAINVNYVCGFDQAYGICAEAALKFGETMKIPSFAFEAEEFNHGPNLQLTPNYTVFFVDDLNKGHNRLIQLWKATSFITDRAYLLTDDASLSGKNVFAIPESRPSEPLLEPLYLLPFFQTIAFRATDELNRWKEHPLFSLYREAAPSKTKTISKVMPLL